MRVWFFQVSACATMCSLALCTGSAHTLSHSLRSRAPPCIYTLPNSASERRVHPQLPFGLVRCGVLPRAHWPLIPSKNTKHTCAPLQASSYYRMWARPHFRSHSVGRGAAVVAELHAAPQRSGAFLAG